MLCCKCCSRPSNFYWYNALIYYFLNKNAGDTFTYYILENLISSETKLCKWYDTETSKTKSVKSKTSYIFIFHLKFVEIKNVSQKNVSSLYTNIRVDYWQGLFRLNFEVINFCYDILMTGLFPP